MCAPTALLRERFPCGTLHSCRSPMMDRREDEVREALRIAEADLAEYRDDFIVGVVAALRWELEGGPSPVTGTVAGGRDAPARTAEVIRCLEILEGTSKSPLTLGFVGGVEHSLLWASGGTSQPPV
jgi:hypothetical protein